MRKRAASIGTNSEPDLTSLLDIVFIMLIFFVVTAAFVKEEGLPETATTESEAPPDTPPNNIQLTVTRDCWILFGQQRIDPSRVAARVQAHLAQYPGAATIVSVDADTTTQCAVETMDQARKGGASTLSFRKVGEAA